MVQAFRALAAGEPDRYLVVAAHDERQAIAAAVLARVEALLVETATVEDLT